MYFKNITIVYLSIFVAVAIQAQCEIPSSIKSMVQNTPLSKIHTRDVARNYKSLKKLCVNKISFKEGKYNWHMLLVTNPKHPKGAFWFLPHDSENSAFTSGVYAVSKYGGGFLAVINHDHRYFQGQDPNRNFGETTSTARTCSRQNYPAPKYSKIVFKIINTFRKQGYPYLALHNNTNGGGVSMLKSSKTVHSYSAHGTITKSGRGLEDEDTIVYIAGVSNKPDSRKLKALLKMGLNTKYEVVNKMNNDCSMSNYVVLRKGTESYYNLESQLGDTRTQKLMIDRLMRIIK